MQVLSVVIIIREVAVDLDVSVRVLSVAVVSNPSNAERCGCYLT